MVENCPLKKIVYKIKRSDGKFSTGGVSPSFTKKGKDWKRKGYLSNHINIADYSRYKDCVVIEYEVSYSERQTVDLQEMIYQSEERKQKLALERNARIKANRRKYLLKELKSLDK